MRLSPPRAALATAAVATVLAAIGALAAPPATAVAPASVVPAANPPADTARPSNALLTLPEPTGRSAIGSVPLHLVDAHRADPWGGQKHRELMVSVWYPARSTAGYPRARWLTPAEAGSVGRDLVQTLTGKPGDLPGVDAVRTHAAVGAPVAYRRGGHPVVLFSPGYGAQRDSGAALVEDLVSRGYAVVTIDHPHDATAVEFPGGRLVPNTITALIEKNPEQQEALITKALDTRVADTRFVLDELGRRYRGQLDLTRVGMVGHSLGGATAAQVAHDDPRVTAGINLDGNPYGSVVSDGMDEPFLLIASGSTTRENTPAWGTFYDNLRGWRREVRIEGTEHLSFHDVVLARAKLARIPGVQPAILKEAFGTLDGQRAVARERTYVGAFFDLHLRGIDRGLFG